MFDTLLVLDTYSEKEKSGTGRGVKQKQYEKKSRISVFISNSWPYKANRVLIKSWLSICRNENSSLQSCQGGIQCMHVG
jgi:hypothetical protein